MKEPLRYTLNLDFPFKDPLPEMVLDKDGDWVDYYEAKMLLNKFTFRPIDTLGETHKHVLLLYKGDIYEGWLDDTEEDPGWCVIKYGDNMILGKPTHWMPKPELPKG
jgi:hypothetical protein